MIIYLAINTVNDKAYVGQTTKDFHVRRNRHLWDGAHGTTNSMLHKALRKYGAEVFRWVILERCANLDDLNTREQYYISYLSTLVPFGYNLNAGGQNAPKHPDTGARISLALTGKRRSVEQRLKLSIAHTGLRASEQTRQRISDALRGRVCTAETRKKLSAAHTGKTLNAGTRKKISESKTGISHGPLSTTTKKKLSDAAAHRKTPIILIHRDTKDIRSFASVAEAARCLSLHRANINKVRWGHIATTGGWSLYKARC